MATHLFILVHGTFARDAEWVQESSALCRLLGREFPNSLQIRFNWSGRNTHSARLVAAQDLGRMILDVASEYPEAKIHIVAHSHGGNIAYYACRNSKVNDRVTGIVCISTPFIICGLVDIEFLVWRLFSLTAGAVNIGIIFAYLAFIAALGGSISIWVVCVLIFVGFVIVDQISDRAAPRWKETFRARQQKVFDRISLPTLNKPVLVVKASGDEAAGWLRLSYLMTAMSHFAHRLIFISVLLATLSMLPVYFFILKPNGLGDALFVYSTWFYIIVGGFASYVLIIAVSLLVRANPLAFGWEGIGDSLVIALTVWPAPSFMPFTFLDIQLKPWRLGLRHSALYAHDEFLRTMPVWISHADRAATPS